MVSETTYSATRFREKHEEPANDAGGTFEIKINQLKKQIEEEIIVSIKKKLQRNGKNLECQVSGILSAISRKDSLLTGENKTTQMLSYRIEHPLCMFNGFSQGSGDKDCISNHDKLSATMIRIPCIERLPTYTTYIHLARNQRMTEDQSIVGRRRIYYNEQHGTETLLCSDSDSEEESAEPEEEKHEYSEVEDRIIGMAFEEHGFTEEALNLVSQLVGGTSSEIQERYNNLKGKNMGRPTQHSECSQGCESRIGICLEKSLSAALDSFDNLFCRRCIKMFDCRLHSCSQPLIYPSEKQPVWSELEGDKKPCGDQCYLKLHPGSFQDSKTTTMENVDRILTLSDTEQSGNESSNSIWLEERCSYVTTPFATEVDCYGGFNLNVPASECMGKRKVTNQADSAQCDSTLPPDGSQDSCKRLRRISDDIITVIGYNNRDPNMMACSEEKHMMNSGSSSHYVENGSNKLIISSNTCHEHDQSFGDGPKNVTNETESKMSNPMEGQVDGMLSLSDWNPLEKDLYLKGVEMFGKNSCLIARNLLPGLKTCMEVATYMHAGGVSMLHGSSSNMDRKCTGQGMPSRSRWMRKKGKTRKFKYSLKSAGLPSIWKRLAKDHSVKQYTPCGCQPICGKECPCLVNGTCCEKYCGCSKSCKNKFRGCHCAKSQCRSRHCPCFAANRECDPDVCRNCWVSCGDGSLGEPPRHKDGQCANMRLLLRQKQRIILARSDVTGWGAFLKNPVNKNDYLGEYTGELISQREADKRGKIYDRANSSFLFNLNDQYVLDAYRKGDKLKFANHSSKPNCYAKVMMVAGDHRVAIFANERIEAGEEIFYDYHYSPDQAPQWFFCKPGTCKRGESAVSHGRAKKNAKA